MIDDSTQMNYDIDDLVKEQLKSDPSWFQLYDESCGNSLDDYVYVQLGPNVYEMTTFLS